MDIMNRYRQFQKGVEYFRSKWNAGQDSPAVRRQLEIFEKDVVNPFDKACAGLSIDERQEMENQI